MAHGVIFQYKFFLMIFFIILFYLFYSICGALTFTLSLTLTFTLTLALTLPGRQLGRDALGTQMAGRQMAYGQRTLAEMLPYQHTKRRRGTDEWEKNAESAELSKVKGHAERK